MTTFRRVLGNQRVQWSVLIALFLGMGLYLNDLVTTSRPGRGAKEYWERYHSPILPRGYSDFRPHWQHQDIGVHIFSFRPPAGLKSDPLMTMLARPTGRYRLLHRDADEVVLRRPWGRLPTDGFDELRFRNVPAAGRVYAMFSDINGGENERSAHPEIVDKFRRIAAGEAP